jgi:molybdate transport system substrate-binding protein
MPSPLRALQTQIPEISWSRTGRWVIRRSYMVLMLLVVLSGDATGEDLVLFGAGSLREVMTQMATDYQTRSGVTVRTAFGPSGLMRERIEKGERVDLFASADIGHPLKLREQGHVTTVAMFTRNTLCAVAMPTVGLTTENFLDRLLDPGIKLGTSTPKADPAGDYTWAMFRLVERLRPGSFVVLDKKARQIVGGTLPNPRDSGKDAAVIALRDGVVDIHLGYCTSARLRLSQFPTLQVIDIPEALRVGPEYGLALLKDAHPATASLMLYILSVDGQATLEKFGFLPVGLPRQAKE